MAEHFDVVVVGSGFGGSVAAYRLAEAGLRVCVLERGRAWPQGSFPRTPLEMRRNFWDPSEGLYGLFDMWTFRGIEALVSSGLGGGSLIYANVLIRKDESWFVHEQPFTGGYEHWPISRADLEPHYDNVERVLGATPYPFEVAPYSQTAKTIAFRDAARHAGHTPILPNLAITFADGTGSPVPGEPIPEEVPTLHGRTRYTCRLCGECDLGCNYGSKNTLDHTYLSRAKHAGAAIRHLCEVRNLERIDGGYNVHFVEHDESREGTRLDTGALPPRTVSCTRLVVAAGALGSTFLLLKNRDALGGLSSALGTRFCGNGDILGFISRAHRTVDGRAVPRVLDPSGSPVITSTIRVPDLVDGGSGRGFYIQDGGYPDFLSWVVESMHAPSALTRAVSFAAHQLWAKISRSPRSSLGASLSTLLGDAASSSSTMPLLGMGRDVPDGRMYLRSGYLQNDWRIRSSRRYFKAVRRHMSALADGLDARFRVNPLWYLRRVITVHPVGGAPMGRTDAEGVVDSYGKVFGQPGLYVLDGSAMPGPVGPNPSLTISAFADRASERIADEARSA